MNKNKWYYCKFNGTRKRKDGYKGKENYCKQNYDQCYQGLPKGCKDFKYRWYKSFKRFFFLRKLWFELKYDLLKIRRYHNRTASLSAYGVKKRGTIQGTIPKKYKGSIEKIKKFEIDYIDYLKSHKTWDKDGLIKITLYNKYLKEDEIDIDKIPFDWNIQNKKIKKVMFINE